jgi:hypothetical protein
VLLILRRRNSPLINSNILFVHIKTLDLSGLAFCRVPGFIHLCVNQEAKPKRLKYKENQSFFTVEKTKSKQITVNKQKKWPNKYRNLVVESAQRPFFLDWTPGYSRRNNSGLRLEKQFAHLSVGPAIVSICPFSNTVTLVINHIIAQSAGPAIEDEMLVIKASLTSATAMSKQPHMPNGVHPAVTDGLPEEVYETRDIEAIDLARRTSL